MGSEPSAEALGGEEALSNQDSGTPGYQSSTPGYPNADSEPSLPVPSADDDEDEDEDEEVPYDLDLEIHLPPREAAKYFASSQPVAHDGKAGWAVVRADGRAVWIGGETQFDVMMRGYGAPRDEPGLTDLPAGGGLPDPAPPVAALEADAAGARARRVQINLKLAPGDAAELERAAELFGVPRTTLARILVNRGAREILDRAGNSGA